MHDDQKNFRRRTTRWSTPSSRRSTAIELDGEGTRKRQEAGLRAGWMGEEGCSDLLVSPLCSEDPNPAGIRAGYIRACRGCTSAAHCYYLFAC